jgi:hypothetical protein
MRIVFLKMADEKGVTAKAITALRKKYPEYRSSGISSWFSASSWSDWTTNTNKVTEVNLIPLYQEWSTATGRSIGLLRKMVEVRQACSVADKIMLGIHGEPGDTTSGHVDLSGVKKTITYQLLAQFISLFLPRSDKAINLALIMCYGARATDPRLNHTGALTAEEVKSSFAYKFFKQICLRQDVVMTARTGAVSFSERDGRSLVQTEAAVGAQLDNDVIQRSNDTLQARAAYDRLWDRTSNEGGKEAIETLRRREDTLEQELTSGSTNVNMASGNDLLILNYLRIKNRVNQLTPEIEVEQGKYGKFVYRYDRPHGRATVTRKYPNPAVLYEGAL